ncbi:uncharacterized protein LOC127812532 [Diospyros lotus]|uniref:uncharacterized protein LOC127812532 n=1 Tax=Diospyros lotus TaxID=55363 RepID=UPI00224C89BE|nr:uncharacterized protein LOC127812532 [Diospyros lotus]
MAASLPSSTLTLFSRRRHAQTPSSVFCRAPSNSRVRVTAAQQTQLPKPTNHCIFQKKKAVAIAAVLGAGFAITLVGHASAAELPLLGSFLQLNEPPNALSLPTWAVHVSSVVEWVTAMALVWQYGEKCGYESWKGLSWGMVPLLGGALCACTWHFFYNSESLDVLVALQAALTVIGNATICFAAYRICRSSEGSSKKS